MPNIKGPRARTPEHMVASWGQLIKLFAAWMAVCFVVVLTYNNNAGFRQVDTRFSIPKPSGCKPQTQKLPTVSSSTTHTADVQQIAQGDIWASYPNASHLYLCVRPLGWVSNVEVASSCRSGACKSSFTLLHPVLFLERYSAQAILFLYSSPCSSHYNTWTWTLGI